MRADFTPYVGAGPSYFLWFDEKPGAAAAAAGADDFKMSDELGLALQAGVDVPLNPNGLALSFDAKRYFIGTTARWYANGVKVIETEHQLDPWVLSAGLGLKFDQPAIPSSSARSRIATARRVGRSITPSRLIWSSAG